MASITVNWSATDTPDDSVLGHRVYRSTIENPSYPNDFNTLTEVGKNTTSYTDNNPEIDSFNTYAVTAFNSAGESSASVTSSIEIQGLPLFVNGTRVKSIVVNGVEVVGISVNGNQVF